MFGDNACADSRAPAKLEVATWRLETADELPARSANTHVNPQELAWEKEQSRDLRPPLASLSRLARSRARSMIERASGLEPAREPTADVSAN